ncbi:uncharacterized protein N7496_003248 [Penicillium cataractarum]|uniref:Uncharacterized protein n=1 Tax=Penicillium cataractarum TaxID=2100454 RepID=A0A9W9SMQ4_9EURO|nr:uncharacterized protein N7496_003248 [Penicillium cataractarum]KAJ5380820.1 hypothetical protein N7496_003248 [Penicillium cataractarum]
MQPKSRRRRRLLQKLWKIFNPVASKTNGLNLVYFPKAQNCPYDFDKKEAIDDDPQSSDNIDAPPQYSSSISDGTPANLRNSLEAEIVHLWKKVWLGLYEIDVNEHRLRSSQLDALYLGAGMTGYMGRLGALKHAAYKNVGVNNEIASLKLFDGLSITTLQSVLEILRAYESEIDNLERLYGILRRGQRSLRQSTWITPTDTLQRQYLAIAEPMERRIKQYDIRMDVLNHEMRDEVMPMGDEIPAPQGQLVYEKAFPGR